MSVEKSKSKSKEPVSRSKDLRIRNANLVIVFNSRKEFPLKESNEFADSQYVVTEA